MPNSATNVGGWSCLPTLTLPSTLLPPFCLDPFSIKTQQFWSNWIFDSNHHRHHHRPPPLAFVLGLLRFTLKFWFVYDCILVFSFLQKHQIHCNQSKRERRECCFAFVFFLLSAYLFWFLFRFGFCMFLFSTIYVYIYSQGKCVKKLVFFHCLHTLPPKYKQQLLHSNFTHKHPLGAATATHKNTRKFVKLKPRAIIYWY